jgi:hypothetical protein
MPATAEVAATAHGMRDSAATHGMRRSTATTAAFSRSRIGSARQNGR